MSRSLAASGDLAFDGGVQQLAALLALALATVALLIGVAGPDPRLMVQGIALSSVLFLVAMVVVVVIPCLPGTREAVLLALMPVSLLALTLPISLDPVAGAEKIFNLLASALVASVLMAAAVQRIGTESALRWVIVFMVVLLLGAVAYKIRYGFFDRQVLFLMNGPIVFARLMGLACLFCMVALSGFSRIVLALLFFLAVVWTASKGPILALVVTIALYTWLMGSRRERVVFVALLVALVVAVLVNYEWLAGWQPLSRVFLAIDVLSSIGGTETDSVGSRILLIRESVDIVREHPLGIGIGSWSTHTGIRWAEYPHNFVLELWNEGGLVLGTLAAVPYLLFLARRVDAWWIACIFLLLCQQVSGDLLDSRYWLTFAIVGFLCRAEGRGLPVAGHRTAPLHG
jgi:O-antigen ligase